MYKYQNKSTDTQTLIGDGDIRPRIVEPDAYVISDVPIENPNFEYVGEVAAYEEQQDQPPQPNQIDAVQQNQETPVITGPANNEGVQQ